MNKPYLHNRSKSITLLTLLDYKGVTAGQLCYITPISRNTVYNSLPNWKRWHYVTRRRAMDNIWRYSITQYGISFLIWAATEYGEDFEQWRRDIQLHRFEIGLEDDID